MKRFKHQEGNEILGLSNTSRGASPFKGGEKGRTGGGEREEGKA